MPKFRIFPTGKFAAVRILACVGILFYFVALPHILASQYEPREGDILFQSLPRTSDLVKAIEGVTESKYSHCGVVIRKDGQWLVNEALGTVRSTPLRAWIRRGRGYSADTFRLKKQHREHIPAFLQALEKYQGLPYDSRYRLDDDYIYCSELVYKAWKDAPGQEMGSLDKLGDMNWKPYEATIRKYEGGEPPLDRLMITPIGLSKAPQLERVQSTGL